MGSFLGKTWRGIAKKGSRRGMGKSSLKWGRNKAVPGAAILDEAGVHFSQGLS